MARWAASKADSVACHLASDVSRVFRRPSSFIQAACMTRSFDVSYPSTIFATWSWTNWYLPIGWPNVCRSRAYSTERSRQARITPHAPAATVKRPWSRPYIAISKPCPSAPTRCSAGTSTFSKKSSPVEPTRTPSLFSMSRAVKPGMLFSSRKAEMPLWPAEGSVFANTSAWSASVAADLLAAGLRDQPALLLLLARVAQERERVEADVDGDQRAEGGLAALDLLAGERLGDEVEPRAAVLLGDRDPEDAELGHALDHLRVEPVRDVVLDRVGEDPLVDEAPDGLLEQPLLVGQPEVHGPSLRGEPSRASAQRRH